MSHEFRIAVFPGDGIGREVMAPCLTLLEAVTSQAPEFRLRFESHEAGAELYLKTGVALPEARCARPHQPTPSSSAPWDTPTSAIPTAPRSCRRSTCAIVSSSTPASGRFACSPACASRSPIRARTRIDFVIVRESTEGLFAARTESRRDGDEAVLDTMRITRRGSERLFESAFALARRRRRPERAARVTCVDKANVLPSMAFFRRLFLECAARHPDIAADCLYVDAAALRLVQSPWDLDVLVTENMFGDILSDLGAGLMGGMGMAPSADVGDAHAVFQPCHGTAPDIAGRGRGQSDRDVPVGGDDARLAWRSALGPGVPARRPRHRARR